MLNDANGRFSLTRLNTPTILGSLAFYRYRNARGWHIYIRAASSGGLLLLDDVNRQTIRNMKRDGLPPALVVETSPDNFQAWIKLGPWGTFEPRLVTKAAKLLARRYEADPNSADWRHFGRLSGFTNRKPKYRNSSHHFPFVLIHEWSGCIAPAAASLLSEAAELVHQQILRPPSPSAIQRHPDLACSDRSDLYQEEMQRILAFHSSAPWRSSPDWSRMDWMVARNLRRAGYDREMIHQVLASGSPGIMQRKASHVSDYLSRTLDKVFTDDQRS